LGFLRVLEEGIWNGFLMNGEELREDFLLF
jgi:hypothetical protein